MIYSLRSKVHNKLVFDFIRSNRNCEIEIEENICLYLQKRGTAKISIFIHENCNFVPIRRSTTFF